MRRYRRIGNQKVNPPKHLNSFLNKISPIFRLTHMAWDADRFNTLSLQSVDSLIYVLFVSARDYDLAAWLPQFLDDGLADASGGGGDYCDFALQWGHAIDNL